MQPSPRLTTESGTICVLGPTEDVGVFRPTVCYKMAHGFAY